VLGLDRLESGAEVIADLAEPGGGGLLAGVHFGVGRHLRLAKAFVCRMASPNTRDAATATLIERKPSRIGIRTPSSASSATLSGTPALSRPSMRISLSPYSAAYAEPLALVVSRTSRRPWPRRAAAKWA